MTRKFTLTRDKIHYFYLRHILLRSARSILDRTPFVLEHKPTDAVTVIPQTVRTSEPQWGYWPWWWDTGRGWWNTGRGGGILAVVGGILADTVGILAETVGILADTIGILADTVGILADTVEYWPTPWNTGRHSGIQWDCATRTRTTGWH